MKPALRTTFYSYKGGVGRTLALLNVAAVLAEAGRRVVAVDLDLEAPGFGLSALTRSDVGPRHRGVSDLLLGVLEDEPPDLLGSSYALDPYTYGDRLRLMPAGNRPVELAGKLGHLYRNPKKLEAQLFELLVTDIDKTLEPDFILFDSRTGLTDISGVCTIELPQVMVAVTGLNEQNRNGMKAVLADLREHPYRTGPVATLLALSPVPRVEDFPELRDREALGRELLDVVAGRTLGAPHPLLAAIHRAQAELLVPILEDLPETQKTYPGLRRRDLLHVLEYDPMVPVIGELQVHRQGRLARQYRDLARTLERIRFPQEPSLVLPAGEPDPDLPIVVTRP